MACNLSNITLDCDASGVGGIQKIYAAEANIISFVSGPTAGTVSFSDLEINGATLSTLDGESSTFSEFSSLRGTSQVNETLSMGDRGATIYTQVVSAGFSKITAEKQEALNALATKSKLCVIILDYNNQYWLIGNEHGAYLSTANSTSGLNASDQNGLSIEITGASGRPMLEVTEILD